MSLYVISFCQNILVFIHSKALEFYIDSYFMIHSIIFRFKFTLLVYPPHEFFLDFNQYDPSCFFHVHENKNYNPPTSEIYLFHKLATPLEGEEGQSHSYEKILSYAFSGVDVYEEDRVKFRRKNRAALGYSFHFPMNHSRSHVLLENLLFRQLMTA